MDTSVAAIVWLTLVVAAGGVALALPVALACAMGLASRGYPALRVVLDALVHLPLVLPPVVVGWALLVVFGAHGVAGQVLARLGLRLVFTRAGGPSSWGAMPTRSPPRGRSCGCTQHRAVVTPSSSRPAPSKTGGPTWPPWRWATAA